MKLVFRVHALQRMAERSLTIEQIRRVIGNNEVIEEYPNDTPYPSKLILGWSESRPVHAVIAENVSDSERIVITAYEPDPLQWEADFRRRRP